jgi:hypothetical protein
MNKTFGYRVLRVVVTIAIAWELDKFRDATFKKQHGIK